MWINNCVNLRLMSFTRPGLQTVSVGGPLTKSSFGVLFLYGRTNCERPGHSSVSSSKQRRTRAQNDALLYGSILNANATSFAGQTAKTWGRIFFGLRYW